MSHVVDYGRTHRVLANVARDYMVTPTAVRVAVLADELGDKAYTHELARAGLLDGQLVRRAVRELRAALLATGADENFRATPIKLTATGRHMVKAAATARKHEERIT